MLRLRHRRGFSLLEVLVALAILMAGLLVIAAIFPISLQAQRDAEDLTTAISLAQMKVEEIRRDDSSDHDLFLAIRNRTTPTPPQVFPNHPKFTYSFSGASQLYPGDAFSSTDPRTAFGPARVIIRYSTAYRQTEDVIYELRFGEL